MIKHVQYILVQSCIHVFICYIYINIVLNWCHFYISCCDYHSIRTAFVTGLGAYLYLVRMDQFLDLFLEVPPGINLVDIHIALSKSGILTGT